MLVAVASSQLTSGLEPAAVTDVELFEPKHYSTSSLYGSRGGGTRLRLVGNGLLNPDGSFDTTIVVTIGGLPATLISFLSSSTQLVVDTPSVPDSTSNCCHEFKVRTACLHCLRSSIVRKSFPACLNHLDLGMYRVRVVHA